VGEGLRVPTEAAVPLGNTWYAHGQPPHAPSRLL